MSGGGGGGGATTTTYTYQACLVWGLCEGPIQGVGTIWSAKTPYTAAALGYSVYTGTSPQAPWGFLAADSILQEEWMVPAAAPFTVTVNYPGGPFTDEGVVSGTGQPFTVATGAPAEGQYSVSGGTYTFAAADAARNVTIKYTSGNQQPPSHALAYPYIAYLAGSAVDLGDSAQLPNHNVEIYGLFSNSVPGSLDADPSLVVNELLTNRRWGCGNVFAAAWVGDLTSYQAYCLSAGLLVSVAYTQQQSAAQMIGDLATYTNADVAMLSGKLTLLPRGDQPISGNGATWTPPPVVATLGDDDWIDVGNATTSSGASLTDPLVPVRSKPSAAVNQVTIEVLNRANQYSPEPITARDPAAIAAYGLNSGQTQQAHMFADMRAGRKSAQLLLQRGAARQTWQGTIGAHRQRLDIGDWIEISRSTLGLVNRLVRITEITRPQDRTIQLVMEEIPTGAGTAAAHNFAAGLADAPRWNAAPGPSLPPIVFDAPIELSGGALEVWLATAGGPDWGGCQVWVSSDNVTYARAGVITAGARMGLLTAPLPIGADPDTVDAMAVDLSASTGALISGTQADADALLTLCWLDGELVAYQTATLTASHRYTLTYLRRGAYGTAVAAHAAGAPFVRLDGTLFKTPFPPEKTGKTVFIKLVSFNIFGGALQDISQVTATAYTIKGTALSSPLPEVTGLATVYVAGTMQLTWSPVSDFRSPVDYEMRMGPGATTAQVIGRTPLTRSPAYGNGTYWVAAHYKVPNGGPDVYGPWAEVVVAGAQLVKNVVATFDEAASGWTGSLSSTRVVDGSVRMAGGGDMLACPDVLALADVIMYGGAAASGCYTVADAHRVLLSGPAPCTILASAQVRGQAVSDDILSTPDVLALTDVTGALLGPKVSAIPQIRTTQDGTDWGAWQNWIPGAYVGMGFDFRVALATADPAVMPILSGFSGSVDVPDRVESLQVTLAAAAATPVTYPGVPFNGSAAGPGVAPVPQVTILGAQAGDDLVITNVSLSGFIASVVNGGAIVARTISCLTQGY